MKNAGLVIFAFSFMGCSTCPETANIDTSCFTSVAGLLTNDSVKSFDFSREITCFQWDDLWFGGRGSYEKYPCMNFTLIDNEWTASNESVKGSDLEPKLSWFDGDRHWQMIYFYHKGKILNEALAISEAVVSFDSTQELGNTFFERSDSKFMITDRVYGGPSMQAVFEHRQMIRK